MDTTLRDELIGRVVDERYHVESRIARGGMATVYLALDRRLDRDVALKVLRADLAADPEFVSRFVREARSAARLSHPNVVQVFDQGSDGDLLYLAMEYLPGRTLRDVIGQRGALTPREALSVLEPVLDALGAAHRAGIMHRDVKPENVIMTDDGRIKVADFGLARAAQASIGPGGMNRLFGTVGYLAPELVSRGVADARADVYAAGIMLFEMLTGRQPYTGQDPIAVAYRHVHETVPAPSVFAPGLSAGLDELVLAATAKNPDDRPPSADRMLADVRAVRAELPAEVLDLRAPAPATVILAPGSATQLVGAPVTHQATRALAMPDRPDAGPGTDLDVLSPLGRLVPRLQVHDDEPPPPTPGLFSDPERRNRLLLVVGVVVALVLALGVWWTAAGPGAYTRTPETTGEKLATAEQILHRAGLTDAVQRVFSNEVAAGLVVTSSPAAGDRVHKGGSVTLKVSKGPDLVVVPQLAGLSKDDAVAKLSAARLKVGEITAAYNADVAKDKVISSTPDSGAKIASSSAVSLVFSKGPQPVQVPTLTTLTIDQARQQLQQLGLQADVTQVDAGILPAGIVIAQDPQPGNTVNAGDTVKLTVTQAPAMPNPGPMVTVPKVTGQSFDQAAATLQAAGFQVQRRRIGFGDSVFAQNPNANSQARQGSKITLLTL